MNRKNKIKKFFKLASEESDIGFDLREGDTDANTKGEVSLLQELLELYGFKLKQYGVDGYFGPETKGALLLFQRENSLRESGIADDVTRKLIFEGDPKENVETERSGWLRDTLQSIERDDSTEGGYSASGGTVSAEGLYGDLFSALRNRNLCIAMVANAISESNLNIGIAGDCGDYAKRRSDRSIMIEGKGLCCSYGLWQYNICTRTSMGTRFLKANGDPQTNEEKLKLLTDYGAQVDYMINTLQSRYSSVISDEKTVEWWVDWFVKNIERPRDVGGAIAKRTQTAQGLSQQIA
tara:strand:- start:11109 stop:11990 length:882 start_codon:yes stop_codon:yes gene_type:complete